MWFRCSRERASQSLEEIWNLDVIWKFGGVENPIQVPRKINLNCEADHAHHQQAPDDDAPERLQVEFVVDHRPAPNPQEHRWDADGVEVQVAPGQDAAHDLRGDGRATQREEEGLERHLDTVLVPTAEREIDHDLGGE